MFEKQVYGQLKKEFGDPMEEAAKALFQVFGKGGDFDWNRFAQNEFPAGTRFYAKSGVTGDWIIIGGRSDDPGIKLPDRRILFSMEDYRDEYYTPSKGREDVPLKGQYAAVEPEGIQFQETAFKKQPALFQETGTKVPSVEGGIESWAWANKYLQAQRQVAQAKAIKPPSEPVEPLTIEKLALPAAGIGLAWWLLKGF